MGPRDTILPKGVASAITSFLKWDTGGLGGRIQMGFWVKQS